MVIQRIQSVYLLLVAVLMGIFMFFPVIGANVEGKDELIGAFTANGVTAQSWWLLALDALVVLLALIAIFKYKDLKGQIRLTGILILLILTLLVCVAVMVVSLNGACLSAVKWPIAFPVVSLILAALARRGIKHDKKLLSDSERIR